MSAREMRQRVVKRGIKPGDKARLTRTFGAQEIRTFGQISRDVNPYHFCQDFAEAGRFRRLIVHGLLVASMLTEIGGQWGWLATDMSFEFKAPVYPGDTITLELVVIDLDERNFARAEGRWFNQDGQLVMKGRLGGYPPTVEQRKRMGTGGQGPV